jgi:tRNA pseudouridine38-40 synthase
MRRRIKLTIAYDGTNYSGWQVQPNAVSIQSLVQKAIETLLRYPIGLTGAGRTDAGVHADGQTAHFDTDTTITTFRLRYSINAQLPADIRILEALEVPTDFHARYSAEGKIYHYHLQLDKECNPVTRLYRVPVFGPFDKEAFEQAARYFLGTHDFASFANESHKGAAARGSIRTLRRLDIIEQAGGLRLEFEGNGFLYKMVRNIVGTLLETAKGKRDPKEILQLFEEKNRKKAGATAPPQGLFLMKVLYPLKDLHRE